MRVAAEGLDLTFIANPIVGGSITMQNVTDQGAAIATAKGPVFAYCASGNRSSIVWALSQAGSIQTNELIALPAKYCYQLEGLRAQIDALAAGNL